MKTLEELLKALNAAKAASEEKPEDEALKTALATAQAEYDAKKAEEEGDPDDALDESKLDEKTKKHIAKLRKENADRRTKGKDLASKLAASEAQKKAILKAAGIETEDDKPEEKIKKLTSDNETLVFDKAVYDIALDNGIPKSGVKYLKFLISEAAAELPDGEELSEEALAKIVADVKKNHAGKGSANSGTGGANPPPPNKGDPKEPTLEEFCAMGTLAKSELYLKNKELYERLFREAKTKNKRIV